MNTENTRAKKNKRRGFGARLVRVSMSLAIGITLIVLLTCSHLQRNTVVMQYSTLCAEAMENAIARANSSVEIIEKIILTAVENPSLMAEPDASLPLQQYTVEKERIQREKSEAISHVVESLPIIKDLVLIQNNVVYASIVKYLHPYFGLDDSQKALLCAALDRVAARSPGFSVILTPLNMGTHRELVAFWRSDSVENPSYLILLLEPEFLNLLAFQGASAYLVDDTGMEKLFDSGNATQLEAILQKADLPMGGCLRDNYYLYRAELANSGGTLVSILDANALMGQLSCYRWLEWGLAALGLVLGGGYCAFKCRRIMKPLRAFRIHLSHELHLPGERLLQPWQEYEGKTRKIGAETLKLFLITSLIPVFCVLMTATYGTVRILQNNINNFEWRLTSAANQMDYLLDVWDQSIQRVMKNEILQSALLKGENEEAVNEAVVDCIYYVDGIRNVQVFGADEALFYAMSPDRTVYPSAGDLEAELQSVGSRPLRRTWLGTLTDIFHNAYLRGGAQLRYWETALPIGAVVMDFDLQPLKAIVHIRQDDYAFESVVLLNGQAVLYGAEGFTFDDNDSHYMSQSLAHEGWEIRWRIARSIYMKPTYDILRMNALVFLAFALVELLISQMLSKKLTRDIVRFAFEIDRDSKIQAKFDVPEIEWMAEAFNRMIDRINYLISEVYQKELDRQQAMLQARDAAFVALQSQINPHFIYNTLETVKYMILMDDKRASRTVQQLGALMRLSIGNREKTCSISEELQCARLYVELQSVRYEGRFIYQEDVDEALMNCRIIRFVIQPILENAIQHGLVEDRVVRIRLQVCAKAEEIQICVHDDGAGIDSARLKVLKEELGRHGGVGLKNIHERIRLAYGDGYGLSIESDRSYGTSIKMNIPREDRSSSL